MTPTSVNPYPKRIFLFFLLTLCSISVGLIYAAKFSALSLPTVLFLCLFYTISTLIENRIRHLPTKPLGILFFMLLVLWGVQLIYSAVYLPYLVTLNLLCLSCFVMLQPIFARLNMRFLGILLLTWFSIIVFNLVQIYVLAHFISLSALGLILPLLFPHIVIRLIYWKRTYLTPLFLSIMLSYISALALMGWYVGWLTFMQLGSIPLVINMLRYQTIHTSRQYALGFSFIHIVLVILYLYT